MHKNLEELNREALLSEYSDRTAAEHMQFYLREAGMAESFDQIYDISRRAIFDTLLELQLEDLPAPEEPHTERDVLVDIFGQLGWLPKSKDEVAAAIPDYLVLSDIKPEQVGPGLKAKKASFARAKAIFKDAEADEREFAQIGVQADRGKDKIVSKWLRGSRRGQYLIADMLMDKEFLNQGDWPEEDSLEYYTRQAYWRGFMLFAVEYASDGTLNEALRYFHSMALARRRFASRLYSQANHRLGRAAAGEPQNYEQPKKPTTKIEIPVTVRAELEEEYADINARIAAHAEQSSTLYAAAKKELGGDEPIIKDGKVIGSIPKNEQPSAEKLVRAELDEQERRRKRRSKLR